MKTSNVLAMVWVAILGSVLFFSSPAYASGDPLIEKARDLLHEAWNPAGDPPSDAKRTELLNSALENLKKSAAVYHGQRAKAIEKVKLALEEISKGDKDGKAKDYIRDAVDLLRDIT